MYLHLAIVLLGTAGQSLGANIGPEKNIVGGEDTPEGSRPFQVSLEVKYRNSLSHFCGGSIIDTKWVVTAAHCTKAVPLEDTRIKAGTTKLSSGGTIHEVEKIISHKDHDDVKKNYDIALIQIKDEFKLNDRVAVIRLASSNTGGGVSCVVSGWGYTDQRRQNHPDKMQMLTVDTITNKECKARAFQRFQNQVPLTDNQICSLEGPGKGFCQGDSGGPLTCNGELVGIVSYNIPCARNEPDVYTRVFVFKSWIADNMK